jgi:hypothetical protein
VRYCIKYWLVGKPLSFLVYDIAAILAKMIHKCQG